MKILFIASGTSINGISTVVHNQGESLRSAGEDISYFTISEKGIKGYFKAIFRLKNYLKNNSFHIVHAHYGLSGIVASLAGASPLVVSLMGSDINLNYGLRLLIRYFVNRRWNITIVKSDDMKSKVGSSKLVLIPNGVDTKLFKHVDILEAKKTLGLDFKKKYLLFPSDPSRKEKNFNLANASVKMLNRSDVELISLKAIHYQEVPLYMNASEALLLTSQWEGSPNVIKEAMACNTPIVSTKVGDVEWLLKGVDGSYTVESNAKDIADKLKTALNISQNRTKDSGRQRIFDLKLSSENIALRIRSVYISLIEND